MTVLACSYRKDEISSLHETEGRELKKKKARKTYCLNFFIIEIRQWFRSEDLWLSLRSVSKQTVFQTAPPRSVILSPHEKYPLFHRMLFSFFSHWVFYFYLFFISCHIFSRTLDINNKLNLYQQIFMKCLLCAALFRCHPCDFIIEQRYLPPHLKP